MYHTTTAPYWYILLRSTYYVYVLLECPLVNVGEGTRGGNGNCEVRHPDAAVEGARRGSLIWLRLGVVLHRRSWSYGLLRAGRKLVLHACV